MRLLFRRVFLAAGGTRLLAGEVLCVPFGQMSIDCPGHHPACLVAEVFDLGEGGFTRRALFSEAMLR